MEHPLTGTMVGQFEVLSFLGSGAMGEIFKANQSSIDRVVALKLLSKQLFADELLVKRFEREAKALARLNHPNIITTYDYGRLETGQAFIVMEYVDGEALAEELERLGQFELMRALGIFVQIADGMRIAHGEGVVHRDLKPSNIMLTANPKPDHIKILDFGLAKLTQEGQKLTRTGEVFGSPLYMAPEQCTGGDIDERTDVYAVGVMMFQMLTGVPPVVGKDLGELLRNKCDGNSFGFDEVAGDIYVPDELKRIISSCISVEPSKRISSMEELKDSLLHIEAMEKERQFENAQGFSAARGSSTSRIRGGNAGANSRHNGAPAKSSSDKKKQNQKQNQKQKQKRDSQKQSLDPWKLVAILVCILVLFIGTLAVFAGYTIYQNFKIENAKTASGKQVEGLEAEKSITRQVESADKGDQAEKNKERSLDGRESSIKTESLENNKSTALEENVEKPPKSTKSLADLLKQASHAGSHSGESVQSSSLTLQSKSRESNKDANAYQAHESGEKFDKILEKNADRGMRKNNTRNGNASVNIKPAKTIKTERNIFEKNGSVERSSSNRKAGDRTYDEKTKHPAILRTSEDRWYQYQRRIKTVDE